MEYIIGIAIIVFFAFAYAIKGGSGPFFFKNWNRVREKNSIYDRILDGKVISTIIVGCFAWWFIGPSALLLAAGWLLAVAPSMGEEQGAVGRWGHSWGPYSQYKKFGRMYGVKKALQRGVWIGACMAVATGYMPFILASLLFVPCVFIGQELNYRILKEDGWALAEPIVGAAVFGIPFMMMVT